MVLIFPKHSPLPYSLPLLVLLFTPNSQSLADYEGWRRGRANHSLTSTTLSNYNQPFSSSSIKVQETATTGSSTGSQTINEMLVPLQSTTALICEPVFNQQTSDKSAFWYKNGKKIAEVTGHSNAVLGKKYFHPPAGDPPSQENFPQVGFLIIHSISFGDEGDYWCAKQESPNQPGETTRLRIAFLQLLSTNRQQLTAIVSGTTYKSSVSDGVIGSGEMVVLKCPPTKAVPPANLQWFFNDEPVNFAGSGSQIEVLPNSSLVIQHYSSQHAGVYKCVLSNFADSTYASTSLGAPSPRRAKDAGRSGYSLGFCTAYLRSGILWFLIGCVTTSCIVLVYLLAGMLCYRCYNSRRSRNGAPVAPLLPTTSTRTCSQQPTTCWKQCCWLLRVVADPSASPPGFRKPVAPVADRLIRTTSSTEPIVQLQRDAPNMD